MVDVSEKTVALGGVLKKRAAKNAPLSDRLQFGKVQRIHFVGVGGAGMSGIAEVLMNLGFTVTGSDQYASANTRRLEEVGVVVHIGHNASQLTNSDVVVRSSAISDENCEIVAARAQRVPVVPRAEMLAELMRFSYGIAVAGTHGKTTVTSLIVYLLAEAGLDPTFVIGGRINNTEGGAKLGTGRYLVAEADESDASFLYLQPMIAVVTNIEQDHMETYQGDVDQLVNTFVEFLHHLPFYGQAIMCVDDVLAKSVAHDIPRQVVTYGIDEDADIRAENIETMAAGTRFDIVRKDGNKRVSTVLSLFGRYNVLNALAAIAVVSELGVSDEVIATGLENFPGIARRFQLYGELKTGAGAVTLVDDYGHHPSEIAAVISAIRSRWVGQRLIVIFQPHRYTRTRDLFDDFVKVLQQCDQLLMLDVYSAGEQPVAGVDAKALCRSIRAHGKLDPVYVGSLAEVGDVLSNLILTNDIVLTLGAGDVGTLPELLVTALSVDG